jgi:molybdopterin-dependent oxidoreductase alpha subunit
MSERRIGRGRTTRDHDVPQDDAALKVGAPKDHAVGTAATVSIARHAMRHLGVARTARTLAKINQPGGFDCPGCAWPEPAHGAHLEFCENGAKAVAEEGTLRRIGRSFFVRHGLDDLRGRTEHWLGQQGRLTEPMHLAPGATHYTPISWDDAYALIARELHALDTPDEAAFYTSGRTSNEAAFAYQLLVRALGTNNLPDCSNMCHESSGVALIDTIGIGKGSVTVNDLVKADLIVVAGQNPGTNHPRMLTTLEAAKERGATILTINPLPEAGLERFDNPQRLSGLLGHGTQITDHFLQVKIGGDHALFRAFNHLILRAEREGAEEARRTGRPHEPVLDHEFLATSVLGLDELQADLAELDWEQTVATTGLTREEIEHAARLLIDSRATVCCWAMGLTQHQASVATIQEAVNTLLLRGHIGRPGCGLCPVRGHSNVQGDRTMGIWEKPPPAFLDALQDAFGFDPPRDDGHDVVETIEALRDGTVKVFMAMGGNFASATPDTRVTEAALRNARLTVQVSTKLNRSHVVTGREALILPTLGRTDRDPYPGGPPADAGAWGPRDDVPTGGDDGVRPRSSRAAAATPRPVDVTTAARPTPSGTAPEPATRRHAVQTVTVEDSMSVVHGTRGHLPPPSKHLRSEVRIVCDLARAVLGDPERAPDGDARGAAVRAIPWEAMAADYAVIRRQIEAVVPGFEQFETRAGWRGGFVLPHPPRDTRTFATPTGKAHLTVNRLEPIHVPEGHLLLQTLRSHDQYNTTIYGLDDRYRGIRNGRRVVFVRPSDLEGLGLRDGQLVDLVADAFDDTERRAPGFRIVAYPTARGCAAAYYPETNTLVPLKSVARRSNTPTSKSVVVRLEPAVAAGVARR